MVRSDIRSVLAVGAADVAPLLRCLSRTSWRDAHAVDCGDQALDHSRITSPSLSQSKEEENPPAQNADSSRKRDCNWKSSSHAEEYTHWSEGVTASIIW